MDSAEVAFHRYFQRRLSRRQKQIFRGKADLFRLPQSEATPLLEIQALVNQSLTPEDPKFHFDYIDSDEVQAMAFAYGGYNFVGVTTALIGKLVAVSVKLGASHEVVVALGLAEHAESDALAGISARLRLIFVAVHEFAHHLHGDVPDESEDVALDEFGHGSGRGLAQQAREVAADGFAVYLVLDSLLARDYRAFALEAIARTTAPLHEQDRALLALAIVALVAEFITFAPRHVDEATIFNLTHPPPPARMHFVMQHAILWAEQYRPHLHAWIAPAMFIPLMRSVAQAVSGGEDVNWQTQVTFLSSAAGKHYTEQLSNAVNRYKSEL